jgi:pantothenate kinase
MFRKLINTIKKHPVKLAVVLIIGVFVGGTIMYTIKDKKEEFWRTKYMEETQAMDSLRAFNKELRYKNKMLEKKNKDIKNDMAITILAALRSNFYNLKALKSEDYNTQMYYNLEEYKSNLVPKKIGEKWNINVFSQKHKNQLNRIVDSLYKEQKKK